MIIYLLIISFLLGMSSSSANTCEDSALQRLNTLITQKHFGWCEVDQDLGVLTSWFDSSQSFSQSQWLDPAVWSPFRVNHGQTLIFTTHMISFIILSILANSLVLLYHFSHSAHPKFSYATSTHICLKVHIYTGAVGVLLPLYVFFTTNQQHGFACMLACVVTDYIFCYTAYLQAPNVYGVRNLTIPLYFTCIFLKFMLSCCLLQSLFYEPIGGYKTKVLWLWLCWVLHQTYAWVRVWYLFFTISDTLSNHRYTISVMLAGFMCINYSVGFSAVVVLFIFVMIHYGRIRLETRTILQQAEKDYLANGIVSSSILGRAEILSNMWDETHLDTFANRPEASERALKLFQELGINPMDVAINSISDKVKAQFLFQSIDRDGSGSIIPEKLESFFMGFGVSDVTTAAMKMFSVADEDHNGTIELNEFEKHFRAFYVYAFDDLMKSIRSVNRHSDRNKIHEMANKQRRLRIESIQLCPFMSFRDNASKSPRCSNISKRSTFISVRTDSDCGSTACSIPDNNSKIHSTSEELFGIEMLTDRTDFDIESPMVSVANSPMASPTAGSMKPLLPHHGFREHHPYVNGKKHSLVFPENVGE